MINIKVGTFGLRVCYKGVELSCLRILAISVALSAIGVAGAEPVWQAKPGPWGDLQVRTIYLQPPDSLLATVAKPHAVTRWVFEQTTETAVRQTLTQAGLSPLLIAGLLEPERRVVTNNVVSLYPTVAEVQAIPAPVRTALYAELARTEANEFQHDPVFIIGGDVEDWLQDSGLTAEQKALFRKLLWRRGEALVFSDLPALLTLAQNSEEVLQVFRAITRVRSLLVELALPLKGNRQEFLDYWNAGQPDGPSAAFIKAITLRRAPQSIDITHFLPAIMRQRVYTFPEMELGLKGRFPDCHWTSLNFFNLAPVDAYLDTRQAADHLVKEYVVVDAPQRFGDILCFLDNGEGLHTCVYVADDIVLTKNGDSILAPWALMQIKDVETIYRRSASTRVQVYRLKK